MASAHDHLVSNMKNLLVRLNRQYGIKENLKGMMASSFCTLFGLKRGNLWSSGLASQVGKLSFSIRDEYEYKFITTNNLLLWRAKTLLSKEKKTIDWLKNLGPNDLLFDIGANVGVYTVYAGVRGVNVISFEPEASNYAILNQNIQINHIDDHVRSYCVALSDREVFDTIRLSALLPGSANHTFGENKDFRLQEFRPAFEQGSFCTTLDDLVFKYGLPVPTHIKIDVDGLESKIIDGASKVLRHENLKGLLIEINENIEQDRLCLEKIKASGLQLSQVDELIDDKESQLKMSNFIFTRDPHDPSSSTH